MEMDKSKYQSNKIFSGIKILDFTQVISGSYATSLLSDMGAEVVKVEPPETGDSLRKSGPVLNGESAFFILHNRNKKSICINLKETRGIDLVRSFISSFDVIVENFKPGVMKKLGLSYEEVSEIKPDIVYLSVSGFGHNNSYSDLQAYDNIIQAFSGLASLNGLPKDGMPLRCPLSISDYVSGIYGALAVSSALFHRMRTGEGQYIDVAMYDSLISIMDNTFLIYNQEKRNFGEEGPDLSQMGLKSLGNRHPGAAPHGYYRTQDGYVAHMSLTNSMWNKLLEAIGRTELINCENYNSLEKRNLRCNEIDRIIEEWTSCRSTDEVLRIFQENRLPCQKTRNIHEVAIDNHNLERGIFTAVEHPEAGEVLITNTPIKYSKSPVKIESSSPRLGEHSEDILKEFLGLSEEEIQHLKSERIIY